MRTWTFLLAGLLLAAPWCATLAQEPKTKESKPQAAPVVHGIDPANLDTSVKPCEDFFKYATGGWVAKHPIPPEYPRWGSFDALALRNQEELKGILEAAEKDTKAPTGSIERKLGEFYAAAMDEKKADELGVKPLQPELQAIADVKDMKGLAKEAAILQHHGVNVFFGVGSEQDAKDATEVIAGFHQGGLSLPDRDYYLKDDPKTKAVRDAYVAHVTKVFELLGDPADKAAAEAQTVLKLETALAKVSMSRVERRDPKATYHPMAFAEIATLTPDFDWTLYAREIGLPEIKGHVNVGEPEFFKGLAAELKTVPLNDWKTYLRWHLVSRYSGALSSDFVKENFAFSRTLTGAQQDLPRWKKAVSATNGAMGMALGELYVKQYFSPEAKAQVLDILHHIKAALREDLETVPWMSASTRKAAIFKLDKIVEKIGYPDKWRDYSKLQIVPGDYVGNLWRASSFEDARDLAKIGKPLDRTEWGMTPPTVNAYYDPGMNEIVFPAGILQPPFFDPKANLADNYGGIGAVIGHEITHGFDDQGSQYDAYGNLKNWWTPSDLKAFKERGQCIVDQASQYVVDNDLHLQGKLVEGEAIADLGGLTLAFRAYHMALGDKPAPVVDGFTGDQQFFLSFANVWASSTRPQFARLLATVDPHPPARYRVNGTLSDMPAFAKAFGCTAGPMAAAKGCQVW